MGWALIVANGMGAKVKREREQEELTSKVEVALSSSVGMMEMREGPGRMWEQMRQVVLESAAWWRKTGEAGG